MISFLIEAVVLDMRFVGLQAPSNIRTGRLSGAPATTPASKPARTSEELRARALEAAENMDDGLRFARPRV